MKNPFIQQKFMECPYDPHTVQSAGIMGMHKIKMSAFMHCSMRETK